MDAEPRGQPGREGLRRYALYQRWDSRHLETVRRLLDPQPSDRILEVGCGPGHLVHQLTQLGCRAIGVDANPEAVANAIATDVRLMWVEKLAFPDGAFDAVVAIHAIEHFPHLDEAMAEMARVLCPGGSLLLVYPAEPIRGLFAVPDAIVLYGNPLRARDLHLHKLRPADVRALGERVGLEHVHSEFHFFSSPQLVTLLRRPGPVANR